MIELTQLEQRKIMELEAARGKLERGEVTCICFALSGTQVAGHLRKYIMQKLRETDGVAYYTDWAFKSFDGEQRSTAKATHDASRLLYRQSFEYHKRVATKGRIRWINAMILAIQTRTEVQKDWA